MEGNKNDALKKDYNKEKIETKLKLRKKAINKILMKKTVVFVEDITNEKMDELEKLIPENQYPIIYSHLISNNEPNIIKILSYIVKTFCSLPGENKNKRKFMEGNIIEKILNLFYTTRNKDIFSLCSSILSNFSTDYILFSIIMINEEGIKNIYNQLKNKYFNNPYIISNCINIYKQGLQHLVDLLNSDYNNNNDSQNEYIKDINFTNKRLLCNFVNWILYSREIFFSIPQEGMQSLFKLIELLITTVSVPTQYEMVFDLNYSNNNAHFENLILYLFTIPLTKLEYDNLENYLLLIIEITKDERYFPYIIQTYNNKSIFDVVKKICGFAFLDNNSTNEERENNPVLEPIFISYCIKILTNLAKETINHDIIMKLIYKFFMEYRGFVRTTEVVPVPIMEFLVKLSEYINDNKKIYDFFLSSNNNIINNSIKFYVRNNRCYILVMQFLVNIFEAKKFDEIQNVELNNVIKCIVDGLVNNEKDVNNKSVYCLGKLLEINNKKNYGIDLILKYEENQVIEKLNSLILNNKNSISEDENAEELLKYIENKINEDK
jgi:hypothetical protein